MSTIHSILKQYWGYDTFRPLQEEIIRKVLQKRDTLALMPTGGGKSVCFQVPALMQDGLCLVITPLIALMKDQVAQLKQRGIPALAIYSGMHFREMEKILDNAIYGNFKFLYVSPERLQSSFFKEYLPHLPLNLIAVDEAHCISQWGYDFRPAYLKIAAIREEYPAVPILALTATATRKVQKDIQQKLLFARENVLQKSFARENLSYSVFQEEGKLNRIIAILQKVQGSSIVYCRNRRHTKEIATLLLAKGFSAAYYHAGLSAEERSARQEAWIKDEIRVMVCTNAFGMGIDKPDVRVVIHYGVPDSPEAYYQEAGRAGRDGKHAYAVLLYQAHELEDMKERVKWQFPSREVIRHVYRCMVNYLQLPAGTGEGQYHDFDIVDFAKTFKVNIALAHHVIKILEQEEVLQLNETIFLPSRIMVTAGREALFRIEKEFPALDPLIKTLLRTYESIFDTYVAVSERQLSRILRQPEEAISKDLQQLERHGIIEYFPQKHTPQLLFLQDRVAADALAINMQHINRRKKAYEERLDAMFRYVQEPRCRSRQLLEYFDDRDAAECGICDICLQHKRKALQQADFDTISRLIFGLLQKQPVQLSALIQQLYPAPEEHIQEVLRLLMEEEQVIMNDKGEITVGNR